MLKEKDILLLLNRIIGLRARNVSLGYGSFITMDFGKDIETKIHTKKREIMQKRGEWYLWIYMCAWRIDKEGMPLIGSADQRTAIETTLEIIENAKLKNIEILNNAFDSKFFFENNIVLQTFSMNTIDQEQWMLFTPEEKVLVVGPSSSFSYHNERE